MGRKKIKTLRCVSVYTSMCISLTYTLGVCQFNLKMPPVCSWEGLQFCLLVFWGTLVLFCWFWGLFVFFFFFEITS